MSGRASLRVIRSCHSCIHTVRTATSLDSRFAWHFSPPRVRFLTARLGSFITDYQRQRPQKRRISNLNSHTFYRQKPAAPKSTASGIDKAAGDVLYNFKGVIAYRGSAYKGWQIQNGKSKAPTIQEKLEQAICVVKCEDRRLLRVQGAGRTDAGVHARRQVFNFYSRKLTPATERLLLGINANLPNDIRVTSLQRVPLDFSARYSAMAKTYSFRLQTGATSDPFQIGLSQHIFRPLNVEAMREAARHFLGTHDFTQFSSIPAVTQPLSPVKRLTRMEILETEGGLVVVMSGSGFLYNQCRHMVGCLVAVGLGRMTPSDVPRLLKTGKKEHPGLKHRGWTLASAEGLYLEEVQYPPHDEYSQLMYPELPHDKFGRVYLEGLPQHEVRRIVAKMRNVKSLQFQ